MCPLRGERARGPAPSAGAGEAGFRADPATVGWFDSSRQLHTKLARPGAPYLQVSLAPSFAILVE